MALAPVVDIVTYQRHAGGRARCLNCRHEWEAAVPWDGRLGGLECPACGHMKGIFPFAYTQERTDQRWFCACGNDLFEVNPLGVFCPNCGEWQTFP